MTALKVPSERPPLRANKTVKPLDVKLLPAASFAVSVIVTLDPEATLFPETLTRDVATETPPGLTVTVGNVDVTEFPPIVALMVVAVPEVTPVNTAEYVPFPLSVVEPMVPVLVPPVRVNTTADPPALRLLPLLSLACNVRVMVDPELTVPLETETIDCAKDAEPGVTVTVGIVDVTLLPPIVALRVVAEPAVTPE